MIDKTKMRSLLEKMEHAAEESLQRDAAFHEALLALKVEIDNDPRVRATMDRLQASGRSVFKSFVPHVRIRLRSEQGIYALPKASPIAAAAATKVGRLSDELRSAASDVIRNSPRYRELDSIINEVVGASDRFEGIAAEFEKAGYKVLLCLDLSAYAQIQGSALPESTVPLRQTRETKKQTFATEGRGMRLNSADVKFLQALKIKVDEN